MPAEEKEPDSGLACLALLLRFHGVAADPERIRHRLGGVAVGTNEMLRCARELGLKARLITTKWQQLEKTRLPAIAGWSDGRFVLLGKVSEAEALIQDPVSGRPQLIKRDEFDAGPANWC